MEVPLGDTYYFKFTSRSFSTGAPTTLGGTPVISVYEENNLTQITTGVTLTADYDSVTGLNDVAIVATSGNGYEAGKYYNAVITTGTVGGVSVVGESVGHFRIVAAENVAGAPISDASYVSGTSQTANDNGADINAILDDTGTSGVVLAATATSAQLVDDVWDELATGHLTAGTMGLNSTLGSIALIDTTITGTPTSTTFDFSGGSTVANFYIDQEVYILSGTGAGQVRPILSSSYTGGTTTITVDEAFNVTPLTGARIAILLRHIHPKSQISSQVMTDLDASGSTVIDAILTDTGTTLPAQISALNNLSAAQVNAEVLDVLQTDTFAELSAIPAATSSLKDKITFLFMLARNQLEQTATTATLRRDDTTTPVGTATVSDDGTTATKGEWA